MYDKKLDRIEFLMKKNVLSDEDLIEIRELSNDTNPEIRYRISELLALFHSDKSEEILLKMLDDSDCLVRASACDSLSFSDSPQTLSLLLKSSNDKRFMVRGYAILSIGDIQIKIDGNEKETVEFLKGFFHSEKSEWVKIAVAQSLCVLGEKTYFEYLAKSINSRYYKNRCFAINCVDALTESKYIDEDEAVDILANRATKEKEITVLNMINALLKKLKK